MNENESFWYHNYQVVQAQLVEYYERNQKAIEYIEKHKPIWEEWHYDDYDVDGDIENLLDILKGSDSNE